MPSKLDIGPHLERTGLKDPHKIFQRRFSADDFFSKAVKKHSEGIKIVSAIKQVVLRFPGSPMHNYPVSLAARELARVVAATPASLARLHWRTHMSFRGPKTIGVVWLTTISGTLSAGQNLPAPSPPWASHMPTVSRESDDSQALERQEKIRFSARQKQLMADTAKLISLVADLKLQVDKSTADTWSVDTIRKANEIEKLAHSVKKRLKE